MAELVRKEHAQKPDTDGIGNVGESGPAGAGQAADADDRLEPLPFNLTGAKHIQCTRGAGMPRRTAARRSAAATSADVAPSRSTA